MNILPTIAVPTYTLELPSTKKPIEYRPYLVKEEKILLMALESEDGEQMQKAISEIVKTCLITSVNYDELTMYDVEYIFITIRSKSVGETSNIMVHCDNIECENIRKYTVNFDDIVIANEKEKKMQFDLGGGIIIDMRHPRMGDKKILAEIPEEDIIIATVAAGIETIYHHEEVHDTTNLPLEEVVDFLGNMNTQQFGPLLDVILDQPFVQYTDNWKCSKCGHDNTVEYNGLIDFFI
jgi:hypothetical protein